MFWVRFSNIFWWLIAMATVTTYISINTSVSIPHQNLNQNCLRSLSLCQAI
jgi:hypothetical protein